jgi:hypothetical protein
VAFLRAELITRLELQAPTCQTLSAMEQMLKPGEAVDIPARPEFSAREAFHASLEPRSHVLIAYVLGNFERWLKSKRESESYPIKLQWLELQNNAPDRDIVPELGGAAKVETTLAAIYYLMEQQRAGQPGVMASNGWGNIFYVRDTSGELRSVNIHWCDDGWGVEAMAIGGATEWPIRDRVFVPVAL